MNDVKFLKTGEKATVSGFYAYQRPEDGKIGCNPTPEEQVIPLEKGETAPPVKSCGVSATWRLVKKK